METIFDMQQTEFTLKDDSVKMNKIKNELFAIWCSVVIWSCQVWLLLVSHWKEDFPATSTTHKMIDAKS